ncbi:MAG: glucose-6-phosphate dehydrogenase assembly protein OpcA [Candidatus Nanopelagicales bacterium]
MIRLEDTSGGEIARAIAEERHRMGSPATGMVLTMLILSDEEYASDATEAAVLSARQHPMRILTLIPRPGRGPDQIDAQVMVGGDDGPGEVAIVRLRGDRSGHANSVVIPLLLPDTPVVSWWPTDPPPVPADDPIGSHCQRRITDLATSPDPLAALRVRQAGYVPGDSDLAWTRLTSWRSALASLLDNGMTRVTSASVEAEADNPSAILLAGWLRWALEVEVELTPVAGPGITQVKLDTPQGLISLTRPDGAVATLSRPDVPDSTIALPRRGLPDLLSEELRRLDPDEVYGDVLRSLGSPSSGDASGGDA